MDGADKDECSLLMNMYDHGTEKKNSVKAEMKLESPDTGNVNRERLPILGETRLPRNAS